MEQKLKHIEKVDNLSKFIKDGFNVELPVDGGWGYGSSDATIINANKKEKKQIQYIFSTIKANLHLNILSDTKYSGINLKELNREEIDANLEKVEYEIEAFLKDDYEKIIDEYKEGYGKKDFDMKAHFQKRKKLTKKFTQSDFFKFIEK